MNKMINVYGYQIQLKEFNQQRMVTFKDVDECHRRPEGTSSRTFRQNKERFINGIDYHRITGAELHNVKQTTNFVGSNAKELVYITESGYMMLVKSFTDDLAWDVQRELVNGYFRKPIAKGVLEESAKVMNAKSRLANVWLKLANMMPNNKEYSQICASYASEVITGQKVIPLPTCNERYYTATQVAEIVASNKNVVGKMAKQAGIRPIDENHENEYGKWFFDKSPYSNKEVSSFRYNELGLESIKKLFTEQQTIKKGSATPTTV